MSIKDRIYELRDVHRIVELLSETFRKAIIIEDAQFELVAYSSPNEFSFDPIQQKTILTKRCPLFIIERLKKDGVIDALKKDDKALRIDAMEDVQFYKRVVISLKHEHMVYGYLWIYEAEVPSSEHVLDQLTEIAPYIGELLYEKEMKQKEGKLTDASQFLWKLLNDEFLNISTLHREANLLSIPLPERFSVCVMSIKESDYVFVLNKLKQFLLKEHTLFYLGKGSEIVCLIDLKKYKDRMHLLQAMQAYLSADERDNIYIGIGNVYEELRHVRQSYLEALEVIETQFFLNVEEQDIFYFDQLGMRRHYKDMYKKNITDTYHNQAILRLLKHDSQNKSELVKTLWMFLQTDGKVGETAKRLFIHPNTFNYRMKQIIDISKIDFSDFAEKVELYNELYLIYHVPDYMDYYKSVIQ